MPDDVWDFDAESQSWAPQVVAWWCCLRFSMFFEVGLIMSPFTSFYFSKFGGCLQTCAFVGYDSALFVGDLEEEITTGVHLGNRVAAQEGTPLPLDPIRWCAKCGFLRGEAATRRSARFVLPGPTKEAAATAIQLGHIFSGWFRDKPKDHYSWAALS